MDRQKQRKALFRSKLRESSQNRDKRIDSPLVRYNESDQPVCRVCNVILKSESLWPAHQVSRKHHEAIENVKASAAGMSQASKVSAEKPVELHNPPPSSTLPADFFDRQETKRQKSVHKLEPSESGMKITTSANDHVIPLGRNEIVQPSTKTDNADVMQSKGTVHERSSDNKQIVGNRPSTILRHPPKNLAASEIKQMKAALPDGFCYSNERSESVKLDQFHEPANKPKKMAASEIKQMKGALPYGFCYDNERSESVKLDQYHEPSKKIDGFESRQVKGALPEGFFDNKDADLRARGIEPVKVDINDAYKEFEKEIHDDLQGVDDRLEEEEIDAAEVWEEFESLEQQAYREKVEMVKKQLTEVKASRISRGQRSPAFKGKESSDESSSEEDDEDDFAVDWRAKRL